MLTLSPFILLQINILINLVVVIKKIYIPLTILVSLFSCSLEEGDGGKGSITGRVIAQEKYNFSELNNDSVLAEYPAVNERVYLTYGDNSIYDTDFRTDENGYFKFEDLTKGDYSLTFYSYCDTCDSEINPIYTDVNLDNHKDTKDIGNTYIQVEQSKGKGTITGNVTVQVKFSNPIIDIIDRVINEYPAVNERVYLTYGDNSIYDEDFRTDENGNFKFEDLSQGDYKLTVYSYCDTCDTEITPIYTKITLDSHTGTKDVGTTFIEAE